MIEAVSLAELNTLTEHDFQDAFTNFGSAGNGAYARKGTTSRVMVTIRPKVSFGHVAIQVPEIIDDFLYTSW
jgi:hypothetical protein